jgi:hypothetical protein
MRGFAVELLALAASLVVPVLTRPDRILHGHTRLAFSILISCLLVALGGIAVQVVAWVKALSLTSGPADERWHRRLLTWGIVGGLLTPLLGLGAFICWWVMLDYLRNGPDPSIHVIAQPALEQPPSSRRRERV